MNTSNWDDLSEKLNRWLRGQYRTVSHDLIHDAVQEALIAYLKAPNDYDQSKSSLMNYLSQRATSKLSNMLRKQDR